MVELDRKKLELILYEVGEKFGIKDTKEYVDKIIERARPQNPIKVPIKGHYVVVIEHYNEMSKKVYYSVVAEFYNGVIRCTYTTLLEPKRGLYYTWEFKPSPGSLYLIGRYGHAKVGKEKVEEVKAIKEAELDLYNKLEASAISRIHLLVSTTGKEFEVVNVGISPIKIIPYEEFKEKSKKEIVGKRVENRDLTKLWILPLLVSLLSLPMLLIIFSRNLTGLFVFNSPSLYFLIFIVMLVVLFLFVRYSKLIVRKKS